MPGDVGLYYPWIHFRDDDWVKLAMLYWKRKIHHCRVLTLGIKPGYRASGIDALLIHEMFVRARKQGYPGGEFSWILEDNRPMRHILESFGARAYKIYRVYSKRL